MHRIQQNGFKIETITSSNYHAIVPFLYASDLSKVEINEYCWQIRYIIEMEASPTLIEENFDKYEWATIIDEKMKNLQNEVWENRYDIFEQVEKLL